MPRGTVRFPALVLLAASAALGVAGAQPSASPDIRRVAAYARLYGVVRYFYPSDAAATLDWDRAVVLGVQRARAAADASRLEAALESLFSPLGPGIEIGAQLPAPGPGGPPDRSLVAWRYLGPGLTAASSGNIYRGKRTTRGVQRTQGIEGFVSMMQTVPAQALRGRTIRLQARARATTQEAGSGAALWLRVDRPGGARGFFDNMGGRGIREPDWREYAIEGPVADDADAVAFGAMAGGAVTADFDQVILSVRSAEGTWAAVPIEDPGFEADGPFSTHGWRRVGTSQTAVVSRVPGNAAEGSQHLRLAPAVTSPTTEELFEAEPARDRHALVPLGQGLSARVPLVLSNEEAARPGSDLEALRTAIGSLPATADVPDIDARLAGVAVAWNVFRHFYPYWSDAGQQWDARLEPLLDLAMRANTRDAYRKALRQLVADVSDGHGGVIDTRRQETYGRLPIQLGLIEGSIVVTATAVVDEAPVGAEITAIGGEPAAARLADVMRLTSGTAQWKRARALQEMTMCEKGAMVTLALVAPRGSWTAQLRCDAPRAPAESRPAAIVELTPGVWYVDLTRAAMAQIVSSLPEIARAAGVVFDVRGYPTDAGAAILPHLVTASENDRWMHVARITGQFGEMAGWSSFGWNLTPGPPRIGGKVVFMTDGRAISYAESVMGYVADLKLATIVGSATAGTNGNVARFRVPGEFDITFTGMRVTRHDGQAPHHLLGVQPDIVVEPTLSGLRQGRDEVLDRALAIIRGSEN